MSGSQLILHIGAGKCGSSALQAALSRTPDLAAADGRRLRYLGFEGAAEPDRLLEGPRLRQHAVESAFGYVTFPAVPGRDQAATYAAALQAAWQRGKQEGFVPVLSNEGWIGQAAFFARTLAEMGHPPVEALAFLRAPVDWLNAAYWQWGVWSHPRFERWYGGPHSPYTLAADLEAWAAIPNLRLRVFSGRRDVVQDLATHLGAALPPAPSRNRASPPALIGFLLRNRSFRPNAHSPLTEFVWQRWCPSLIARKPWAVRPADVEALRPLAQDSVERLRRLLRPVDRAALFTADPRWLSERPYHDEILLRPTPLHRLEDLPLLWESLARGLAAATAATGIRPPDLPSPPEAGSDHAAWDPVLSAGLEALVLIDAVARSQAAEAGGA